jgi:hypothetical protein
MKNKSQIGFSQDRRAWPIFVIAIVCWQLAWPEFTTAQTLQTVNMAIPAKSFQMVIYPLAQQKGYMKEEGLDLRVIFIAPTTSIQALLGGTLASPARAQAR